MDFSRLSLLSFSFLLIAFTANADLNYKHLDSLDLDVYVGSANQQKISADLIEYPVLKVTSDAVQGELKLSLLLDADQRAVGLRYSSPFTNAVEFTVDELMKGVVLLKQKGYDVVKLKGEKFDTVEGGIGNMIYLQNALKKSYGTFPMEVAHIGSEWELRTNEQTGRKKFTTMFLKKKTFLGQTVGIEKVIVN